jgi:hypothetical protein
MSTPPTRYPLQWPIGWKRKQPSQRTAARFSKKETKYSQRGDGSSYSYKTSAEISIADATRRLLEELERMGVREYDVVISSNLQLRLDGLPRSGQSQPADPGAAVYWRDKGRDRCMAIDAYDRVEHNIAALAATIEAMRAIERHGGAAILDRAFTGFTALPAPIVAGMKKHWRDVLGFPHDYQVSADLVRERYRSRATAAHPDTGGSHAEMSELNAARDEALEELKGTSL